MLNQIAAWVHRNARPVDLALWRCLFEGGAPLDVADALLPYQNEDGGFGHALEPDNWNPHSTPITTVHALHYLAMAGFFDQSHPAYQGIWRYLRSGAGRMENGWMFTVPGNNAAPHAPWWTWSEEENRKERIGVSAELTAFILQNGEESDPLYQRALREAAELLPHLEGDEALGDMGLTALTTLLFTARAKNLPFAADESLVEAMGRRYIQAVRADAGRWGEYAKMPSFAVRSPDSPLYPALRDLVDKELDWIIDARGTDGVWPVTWQWYGLMDRYGSEFAISANWWKTMIAIEKVTFLRAFGRL